MNNYKILALIVSSIFISSCSESPVEKSVSYEISIRNNGIDNIYQNYDDYWNYAIENYGIETLCGCDCESTLAIIDLWNNGGYETVDFLNHIRMSEDISCTKLQDIFKQRCISNSILEYKSIILNSFEIGEKFTLDEYNLISDLMNSIIDNSFTYQEYSNRWENLSSTSTINNTVSLLVIEGTISLKNHFNSNRELWDQLPDSPGEPEIQAWGWKAFGFVQGAVSSMISVAAYDGITYNAGDEPAGLGEYVFSGVWGGLVGAATSL